VRELPAPAGPIELPALRIRQRSGSFCILRLHRVDEALAASLGRNFGVAWPVQPNSKSRNAGCVLWMGPRQWAILGLSPQSVAEYAAASCGPAPYHLADVSDGLVEFEISGACARDLLAKGCSLDLHPRVFGADSCAQTLLAQTPVLLHREPAAEASFRVHAEASLLQYLRRWFCDAALEWSAGSALSHGHDHVSRMDRRSNQP